MDKEIAMQTLEYSGLKIKLDDEGYLLNINEWNDKVACALAEKEGVDELTKERMDIIKFMRDYYKHYQGLSDFSPCG
jgi:tRNA 2-thiouridine synthesizing protein E